MKPVVKGRELLHRRQRFYGSSVRLGPDRYRGAGNDADGQQNTIIRRDQGAHDDLFRGQFQPGAELLADQHRGKGFLPEPRDLGAELEGLINLGVDNRRQKSLNRLRDVLDHVFRFQ